jgi:phosphatidylglycerophosphate synthase
VLRIVALPFLIAFMDARRVFPTLFLYALVVGSDFVDGYLARKLRVAPSSGALLDSAVDFIFISGVFTYFVTTKI